MADEDATISYDGAGEGPGSQPDPIDDGAETREGPYASEDDETESGDELEDDGGQGGDPDDEEGDGEGEKPPPKPKAAGGDVEARLAEKERQAHGLTIALQRERQRARILEDRFYAVIERAMQAQAEAGGEGEQEAGETPEFDPEDPVARLEHGIKQVAERLDEKEEREEAERHEKAIDETLAWVREDAAAVLDRNPEYVIAAEVVEDHARRSLWGNLKLMHPEVDDETIAAEVERQFARQTALIQVKCRQAGMSYAEVVMATAKHLGWEAGGAAPAKTPARSGRRSSSLDAERAARSSAPSLSHVGGGPPRRQPGPTDALNMDDDEFDDLLDSGKLDFKALATQLASGGRR